MRRAMESATAEHGATIHPRNRYFTLPHCNADEGVEDIVY